MDSITIHQVTITKGYFIHEQGTGYSFWPWSGNADHYEGYSSPVEATLADGYEVGESVAGEPLIYPGGYTAREAVIDGILSVS